MGDDRLILSHKELEPRHLYATRFLSDLCENIHFHYRNTRFEFSVKEWCEFITAVHIFYMGLDLIIEEEDYEEGEFGAQKEINFDRQIAADSEYFPNRFLIEWTYDNTYHIHYRDFRLEVTEGEFKSICDAFEEAKKKRNEWKPYDFGKIKEPTRMTIPMEVICPYDTGHKFGWEREDHREGIDIVKKLIKKGKKIRPILINDKGFRLDGYKRYMAFKELGYKEIEVIVDPLGIKGQQRGESFVEE